MLRQRAKGRLFLGKVSTQFTSQSFHLMDAFFEIFGKHVFEPFAHAFGQDGGLTVRADGQFQGPFCDNSTHVKVTLVGHIRHIEQVTAPSAYALIPANLP